MGFREGRSTIDAIYILKNAVSYMLDKGCEVYATFVDLKAVFDNVDRQELWNMLIKNNVNCDVASRLMKIYQGTICKVRVKDKIVG